MKILKGYVKNQYRSEGSMIERYIAEESVEFCSDYMAKAKPIGVPHRSWLNRPECGYQKSRRVDASTPIHIEQHK